LKCHIPICITYFITPLRGINTKNFFLLFLITADEDACDEDLTSSKYVISSNCAGMQGLKNRYPARNNRSISVLNEIRMEVSLEVFA
jgi:hypothetical protein